MSNTPTPPLKPEEAMKIAQSFARLQHLRNATIKQVADDAEIKGHIEFLAPQFLEHASEFIGCWFVMHNEYEPLINSLMPLANRVLSLMQQAQAAQAQRSQAAQAVTASPEGENKIVGLDGNPADGQ